MTRLGILLSGRGSNFVAIAEQHRRRQAPRRRSPSSSATARRRPASPRPRRAASRPWSCPARAARARSTTAPSPPPCARPESNWWCSPDTCACSRPGSCSSFPAKSSTSIPPCCPPFPDWRRSARPSTTACRSAAAPCILWTSTWTTAPSSCRRPCPVLPSDDEHDAGRPHPGAGAPGLQRSHRPGRRRTLPHPRAASPV